MANRRRPRLGDERRLGAIFRDEVADTTSGERLPSDAFPLWRTSTRLYLVTSEGCGPCELQKSAMPPGVKYRTVDIARVNAKGYNVQTTPTLMVFVDGELQQTRAGPLRGDALRSFLRRWGFADDAPPDDNDADLESHNGDDRNPWTNPDGRWRRGPGLIDRGRDRIDAAKDRFAWWVLGRWAAYAGGVIGFLTPWLLLALRLNANLRGDKIPAARRGPRRRRKTWASA